ncbi:MAG: twin-arginine translocation signal domain-containing protein [Phycisphaerae bacterium]|nr:twin-arginine translocation signal domain-containing protein [Phycisphaerae bacterium]
MDRRGFLAAGAAAVAAGGLPRILLSSNKSGLEPIIVGSGEHTYEVQHDWGRLPPDIAYGNCHGVCEDSQGRIYIKHTVHASSRSKDAMVVFDDQGKFIGSWGAEYGLAGGAHGLHITKEGSQEFLWLCDQAKGVVYKTDLAGKLVMKLGCPEQSGLYDNPGEYHPTNLATSRNGDFYVGDGYGRNWIHHYNSRGEYLRSFGGTGSQRGQLSQPHGIWMDNRSGSEKLAVADRANHRIQYFSPEGRHLGFVTNEMKLPCHFHQRGSDLLVPDLDARVTILDKDDKPIAVLCDGGNQGLRAEPREKFIPGKFITPHSAIFDHAGNIFVVEWVEVGRVTKLKRVV